MIEQKRRMIDVNVRIVVRIVVQAELPMMIAKGLTASGVEVVV
jgi:hypothetical protein